MKSFRILPHLAALALLSACASATTANQTTDDFSWWPDQKQPAAVSGQVHYMGYGIKVSDEDNTGSISTLHPDDKVPYRDIYEYLQGKVAGVQVQGKKISIRGISSINASTDPLFIVDGVTVEDISWINPRDVKSIDVLKDGPGCALYGSRGANGVIIITMK